MKNVTKKIVSGLAILAISGLPAVSVAQTNSSCVGASDIMLVMDQSGSMDKYNKITEAKAAAKMFIDTLNTKNDRVGYVVYHDKASLVNKLTRDFKAVKQNVDNTVTIGNTNIGDGLKLAKDELVASGRKDAKKVIIILTDGLATVGSPTPYGYATQIANEIKSLNTIAVYTIGLGQDVDAGFLKSIATAPSNYYFAPEGQDLKNIYLTIAAVECQRNSASVITAFTNSNANKPTQSSYKPTTGSGPTSGSGPKISSGPTTGSGPTSGSGPKISSGPTTGSGPTSGSGPKISSGPTTGSGPIIGVGPNTTGGCSNICYGH